MSEQLEEAISTTKVLEKNFNIFTKTITLKEIKRLREEVETSLKVFDLSKKNLQIEYINFIDHSVKATKHLLYDLVSFDSFETTDEIVFDYNAFDKRRGGGWETEKNDFS